MIKVYDVSKNPHRIAKLVSSTFDASLPPNTLIDLSNIIVLNSSSLKTVKSGRRSDWGSNKHLTWKGSLKERKLTKSFLPAMLDFKKWISKTVNGWSWMKTGKPLLL
jgi:hypothetical protein